MTDKEAIKRARKMYAAGSDDNIEIDDSPALSHAESGTWVAAWVWVPNEDNDTGADTVADLAPFEW